MVDRKRTCSHATGVAIHTLVARGKRGPSEYLRMTGSPATSLAGEDQIDPPIELLEWQAAVFDRHPAVVVHVIEGLADGWPVDGTVARVDEVSLVLGVVLPAPVLAVELDDQVSQRVDP